MSALDRIDFDALGRELIAFRRDFHKYAESAWTEYRTTARIISELEKLGLPVQFGPQIHTTEKMFGLPKPTVMEACYERALAETDRPDLVDYIERGDTLVLENGRIVKNLTMEHIKDSYIKGR